MGAIKVVTQETLRQAVEDAQSGLDLDTTHEQYTRALFNALPTPPLDGYTRIDPEVQAAHESYYESLFHTTRQQRDGLQAQLETIIAALRSGAWREQQMREALEAFMTAEGVPPIQASANPFCACVECVAETERIELQRLRAISAKALKVLELMAENEDSWFDIEGYCRGCRELIPNHTECPHVLSKAVLKVVTDGR